MNKFLDVDVCKFLKDVASINTSHYKSDLAYDFKMMHKALRKPDDGYNRYFVWLSRTCGTNCENLIDMMDANNQSSCLYYSETKMSGIMAFLVKVKKIDGTAIIGDLVCLDYHSFCNDLQKHRYVSDYMNVTWKEDGQIREQRISRKDYPVFLREQAETKRKIISSIPQTYDESKSQSLTWMKQEVNELFRIQTNDAVVRGNSSQMEDGAFSYVSSEMSYAKTLFLNVRRRNSMKSYVFVCDTKYCANQEQAVDVLKQAMKEYLYSEEGISRYGMIPEIQEDWELPKSFDWVEVAQAMPSGYLSKYGIVKSIENFTVAV